MCSHLYEFIATLFALVSSAAESACAWSSGSSAHLRSSGGIPSFPAARPFFSFLTVARTSVRVGVFTHPEIEMCSHLYEFIATLFALVSSAAESACAWSSGSETADG